VSFQYPQVVRPDMEPRSDPHSGETSMDQLGSGDISRHGEPKAPIEHHHTVWIREEPSEDYSTTTWQLDANGERILRPRIGRRVTQVFNGGNKTCYIGKLSSVGTTSGYPLAAGTPMAVTHSAEMWAWALGTDTTVLSVYEERYAPTITETS
jgi:hypothetical protein